MKTLLMKNKPAVLGMIIGAAAGWCYWYFVGCASGSCLITSRPVNSAAYGAVMGMLMANLFSSTKKLNRK